MAEPKRKKAHPEFRVIPATAGGLMVNINRKARTKLITLIEKGIAEKTVPESEIKYWEAFVRELKKPSIGPQTDMNVTDDREGADGSP